MYDFLDDKISDLPEGPINWKERNSIIKVIGVGGGGSNAVTQMFKDGIKDVNFMICNTDSQALASSPVPEKLQLGTSLTKGLGAGCNPEQGRNAALESIDEIKNRLSDNTQMVFITAGMGGGTGTGAAPVIAKVAKEMGILTIAVVTQPFKDEGIEFLKRAYDGIMELSKYVDSLLIIDNQKLYDIFALIKARDAFPMANGVLNSAVKGIAEIITGEGYINVDFADVKMVMKDSGMALMGIGEAKGENRAVEAVEKAFTSPLLNDYDLKTAKSALINITSSEKNGITMTELRQVMDYITEFTGRATNFKRGVVFDNNIDPDTVSITIVATGFKMNITPPPERKQERDSEDVVELEENEDDGGNASVVLSVPSSMTGADVKLASFNIEDIPHYTQGTAIADYENETALARRERIRREKEEAKKNK